MSDCPLEGAEFEHQARGSVGYPNMKVEAVFDSKVKELSPHRDMTGYSRIVFGEGADCIEACVNGGFLVLRSRPHCRIVITPMNSGAVRIESAPL